MFEAKPASPLVVRLGEMENRIRTVRVSEKTL